MSDWNTAEREAQVKGQNATERECHGTGRIHKAYGWVPAPSGNWNEQQTEWYMRGYKGEPLDPTPTGVEHGPAQPVPPQGE